MASASVLPTDGDLMGAEITHGATLIGHVEGLVRDPVSQRVWQVLTSYGPTGRQVAVPMEWIVRRSAARIELAVGTLSLNDLAERPLTALHRSTRT